MSPSLIRHPIEVSLLTFQTSTAVFIHCYSKGALVFFNVGWFANLLGPTAGLEILPGLGATYTHGG